MQDAAFNATETTAFHGDANLKRQVIQQLRDRRDAGELHPEIVTGDVTGSAASRKQNAFDDVRFPTDVGLPVWLAELGNVIFRGLPHDLALDWPEVLLDSIAPGDDLEHVVNRLGVIRNARLFKHVRSFRGKHDAEFDQLVDLAVSAVSHAIDLHHGLLQGEARDALEVVKESQKVGELFMEAIMAEKKKPRTNRLAALHALWRSVGAATASALCTTNTPATFEAVQLTVTACSIHPNSNELGPRQDVLFAQWKTEATDLLRALPRSHAVIH